MKVKGGFKNILGWVGCRLMRGELMGCGLSTGGWLWIGNRLFRGEWVRCWSSGEQERVTEYS